MSFFQDWLIPLLRDHGLLIVFLTMVAESACIPIPSEIVVPYGGFLAAQGHTQLWAVIVVATLANVVGCGIAYGVGRSGGRALFLKYGRYVLVRPHHLEKADRWFERRGDLTVFFTRMMPGVRTFISLPAGIARMPVGKFFLYSLLGSVPWNAALAYLGYAAGKAAGGEEASWDRLQEQFSRYNEVFYVVLAVAVAALVTWGVVRWRRRRGRTGGTVGSGTMETESAEEQSATDQVTPRGPFPAGQPPDPESGEHLREE
jgi:membrane protein DedA with SNARE-associated domain